MKSNLTLVMTVILTVFLIFSCDTSTDNVDYQTQIEAKQAELSHIKQDVSRLEQKQEAKIDRQARSDDNQATARAVHTELQPEFADVKSVVEESVATTNTTVTKQSDDVGIKIDALTKTVAGLEKKLAEQPKQVVVEKTVVPVQTSANQTQSKRKVASVAVTPSTGKIKLVVTGVRGDGKFWGPMTNWTKDSQPLRSGIGEFSSLESITINGRIGGQYLDKIVKNKTGSVKLVDAAGAEYVFTEDDIIQLDGGPNLFALHSNFK